MLKYNIFFHAEARSPQSRLAILLKSHRRTDASPKICSTPVEHPSLGERLWETASVCHKSFKRHKLLFTVIKRNLLTLVNK